MRSPEVLVLIPISAGEQAHIHRHCQNLGAAFPFVPNHNLARKLCSKGHTRHEGLKEGLGPAFLRHGGRGDPGSSFSFQERLPRLPRDVMEE